MADAEPLPDWEREFLEKQAAGAERAAVPEKCEHARASKHESGHLLYWIRQCMLCREVDWDDLDAEISKRQAVMSDQCPATTRHTPRGSVEVRGLQCRFTRGHDGDHCANAGFGKGDVFWPQEAIADHASSGEDRIREAMAEAQDHPGRIVTR